MWSVIACCYYSKEPDPVLVSAAVVVGVAMVDKMEKDPLRLSGRRFVVVDAISESVEIRSKSPDTYRGNC